MLCLAIALVAAAVLSACGGGDGDESAEPELSKAAYLKKADAVCEKANEQQGKALQTFTKKFPQGPTTEPQKEEFLVAVGITPTEAEIAGLKELGTPDDGGEAEEFIEALEEAIEVAEEDPVKATNPATNPFTDASEIGEAYGFKVCAPAP